MQTVNAEMVESLTLRELRAFCLICECRNLSHVALVMEITQSSVSQMVQRWREIVGDPLFVRARYGVTPTEAAANLHLKIQPLINEMKLAISEPSGFTPSKSDRVFRVHMSDIGQLVFLAELNSFLNKVAPSVRLSVENLPWNHVEGALEEQMPERAHHAAPREAAPAWNAAVQGFLDRHGLGGQSTS